MKILEQNGNYLNGTKIVQLDSGTIEKRSLHLDNSKNPTYTVVKTWLNFESYINDTKQKLSLENMIKKAFKNW